MNIFRKTALFMALIITLTACQGEKYYKFESTFSNLFDTYAIIVGYAKSESEFTSFSEIIYEEILRLHKEFDIYNNYEGINNLKTVNDNAGISPVIVSDEIIDLLTFSKEMYYKTDGVINVALGSVLKIWHEYREDGINNPENAKLPPISELSSANELTNIDDLFIDSEKNTVFLKKAGMSLDVGAVAKGYATECAVKKARESGAYSLLVSIGGNISSVGEPLDGVRKRWGIGIQNPNQSIGSTENVIDTVFANDISVVTSGDYQRFYTVGDKNYNHIIDNKTLMPADKYTSVSVICTDAGLADMLSTAIFILPIDEGKNLLSRYNSDAVWIEKDGTISATDGYIAISKTLGGYSSVD